MWYRPLVRSLCDVLLMIPPASGALDALTLNDVGDGAHLPGRALLLTLQSLKPEARQALHGGGSHCSHLMRRLRQFSQALAVRDIGVLGDSLSLEASVEGPALFIVECSTRQSGPDRSWCFVREET